MSVYNLYSDYKKKIKEFEKENNLKYSQLPVNSQFLISLSIIFMLGSFILYAVSLYEKDKNTLIWSAISLLISILLPLGGKFLLKNDQHKIKNMNQDIRVKRNEFLLSFFKNNNIYLLNKDELDIIVETLYITKEKINYSPNKESKERLYQISFVILGIFLEKIIEAMKLSPNDAIIFLLYTALILIIVYCAFMSSKQIIIDIFSNEELLSRNFIIDLNEVYLSQQHTTKDIEPKNNS